MTLRWCNYILFHIVPTGQQYPITWAGKLECVTFEKQWHYHNGYRDITSLINVAQSKGLPTNWNVILYMNLEFVTTHNAASLASLWLLTSHCPARKPAASPLVRCTCRSSTAMAEEDAATVNGCRRPRLEKVDSSTRGLPLYGASLTARESDNVRNHRFLLQQ